MVSRQSDIVQRIWISVPSLNVDISAIDLLAVDKGSAKALSETHANV